MKLQYEERVAVCLSVSATNRFIYSAALLVDANRAPACAVSSSVTEAQAAQIGKSITNLTPESLRNTPTHACAHTVNLKCGSSYIVYTILALHTHTYTYTQEHKQNASTVRMQHFSLVDTDKTQWFYLTHIRLLSAPLRLHFTVL